MPPAKWGEGHTQEDQRKKVISIILFKILLPLHTVYRVVPSLSDGP